jgi:adenylate cyclase
MALIRIFTGEMAKGREAIDIFLRLSPRDASIPATLSHTAIAYYFERDYGRCVAILRRQIGAHPTYTTAYRWLAAALGQLGRTEEAHEALRHALADPSFNIYLSERPPWFQHPEQYDHFREGLWKAGLSVGQQSWSPPSHAQR